MLHRPYQAPTWRIAIAWFLLLVGCGLIAATGCVTSREHAMRAGTTDLLAELRYRGLVHDSSLKLPIPFDYEATVPGFKLHTTINPLIKQGDTVVVADSAAQSQLRYWIDRAGRIQAECAQKERKIYIHDTLYKEIKIPVQVFAPVPWYESVYFGAVAGGGLVLLVLWLIGRIRDKPPNLPPPTPLVIPVEPAV